MDKYEYKLKTEQMLELMEDGAYSKAAEIADTIDWRRVRNATMLTNVSDIYEKNGDYQKSYEVLNIAYHRAEGSRKIVYRLCSLALKTKNVDEAIRVMVFKNGNKVIYAKNNKETGQPEPNTVAFKDDDTVMLELSENFKVGDIDKWTVVVWVEGDDPECKDDLIGREIKMHMTLTEEHILQEDEVPQNKR